MICIVGCILGWVIATFAGVCLLRDLASKRKTSNGRIAKLGTEVGMMKARLMSAAKKGIVACAFALLACGEDQILVSSFSENPDPSTRVSRPGENGREPSLTQDDSFNFESCRSCSQYRSTYIAGLPFVRGCWHNRSCTPDGAKPFGFPAGVQQPQKTVLSF